MKTNSWKGQEAVAALVGRARAGDHEAFEVLVRRFERPVHGVVVASVGDVPDKPDIVQETFIAAYRALPKLREPEKFGAWLFGIASRLSKNILRKSRRREIYFAEMGENRPEIRADESGAPETDVDKSELSSKIAAAFAELPERQRAALTLFYSEKLTYGEIASFLNISLASVKGLIYRGMSSLREKLPGRMGK